MKSTGLSLLTGIALLVVGASSAAGDLTWQELARRPELWPAQVTVKVAMNFQGGASVRTGQKVNVVRVKANEIDLVTTDGRLPFAAEPDETDALAVAGEAYAKLTPKQRELTYDSLVHRKDLWPARVALTKTFDLGGGKSVRQGDQLRVMNVEPGKVLVLMEEINTTFDVVPQATDLMAQARKFVEDPQAGPRSAVEEKSAVVEKRGDDEKPAPERVIGELEGKLVNSVTGKPEPLDASSLPRYLVFYRGSSTCPITRKFTPTLIKYYQEMKPKHPEFEVIWLMTESVADTGKFAKEIGFSWRAVEYGSTGGMPSVRQPISGYLPQLIVMERNGKVLVNGSQNSAPNALRQLDELLKQPSEQNLDHKP